MQVRELGSRGPQFEHQLVRFQDLGVLAQIPSYIVTFYDDFSTVIPYHGPIRETFDSSLTIEGRGQGTGFLATTEVDTMGLGERIYLVSYWD